MFRNSMTIMAVLSLLLLSTPAFGILNAGPYLQDLTQTSVKVFITAAVECVTIEYGTTEAYGEGFESCDGENIDTLLNDLFVLELTGLAPSTEYHYHVIRGISDTGDRSFMTAALPGEDFTFIAYGDTRTGPGILGGGSNGAHRGVIDAMVLEEPRFVVHTGDFINYDSIFEEDMPTQWVNYFNIEAPLLSQVAMFPSQGNHDDGADFYAELLEGPADSGSGTELYYSFDFGGAHFIGINSSLDYGPGSPQYDFIEADLADHEGTGPLFAFWHKPPFSLGSHGGSESAHAQLAPLMQDFGVDVVFGGHDHIYFRSKLINGVSYIVTGGGGAPLYLINWDDEITEVAESTLHYVAISVSGNNITVTAKRSEGSILDEFTIDATANDFLYDRDDPLPGPGEPSICGIVIRPGDESHYAASILVNLALLMSPAAWLMVRRRRIA